MNRTLRLSVEQFEALRARQDNRHAVPEIAPPTAKSGAGARRRRTEASEVRPLECDVLAAVLAALRAHPAVAFAWRANTGAFEVDGRRVRVGFRGQSDVLGMTRTGVLIAIECKRPGAKATPDQQAFLDHVRANSGVSFVATSVDDVTNGLRSLY